MDAAPQTAVLRGLWAPRGQMKASIATHLRASVKTTRPCHTSSHLSPTTLAQQGGWPVGRSTRCWLGGSHQRARFSTWWNGKGPPLTDYPSGAAGSPKNQRRDSRSHRFPCFLQAGWGREAAQWQGPGRGLAQLPTRPQLRPAPLLCQLRSTLGPLPLKGPHWLFLVSSHSIPLTQTVYWFFLSLCPPAL